MAAVPKDYDLLATLETKIAAAKKAVAAEEAKAKAAADKAAAEAAAYAADEEALEKMRRDVAAELAAAETAAAAASGAAAAAKWGEAKGIASRLAALPQSVEELRALWAKGGKAAEEASASKKKELSAEEQKKQNQALYGAAQNGEMGKFKAAIAAGAEVDWHNPDKVSELSELE